MPGSTYKQAAVSQEGLSVPMSSRRSIGASCQEAGDLLSELTLPGLLSKLTNAIPNGIVSDNAVSWLRLVSYSRPQ